MAWTIAPSLETLRYQLNALFPNRSKASDGGIGDENHSARSSDHNPNDKRVVCARDFTHDPDGGIDCNWLAKMLVKNKDPRIKYIIWNKQICSSKTSPWKWRPYSGVNAHRHHLHLSVGPFASQYNNARAWTLGDVDLEDDVAKVFDDSVSAAATQSAPQFTPEQDDGTLVPNLELSQTAASDQSPPIDSLPPDPPVSTVVEKTVVEQSPGATTSTTTTASSVSDPIEVKKEKPSVFVQIGVAFAWLTGIGFNIGSFIQTKIESMTPQQIAWMIAMIGLPLAGIFWWQRSAKAAQNRTLALMDKASDPNKTTVILK